MVVVTNQAGIARGYYTEEQFHRLTAWMCEQFEHRGDGGQAGGAPAGGVASCWLSGRVTPAVPNTGVVCGMRSVGLVLANRPETPAPSR